MIFLDSVKMIKWSLASSECGWHSETSMILVTCSDIKLFDFKRERGIEDVFQEVFFKIWVPGIRRRKCQPSGLDWQCSHEMQDRVRTSIMSGTFCLNSICLCALSQDLRLSVWIVATKIKRIQYLVQPVHVINKASEALENGNWMGWPRLSSQWRGVSARSTPRAFLQCLPCHVSRWAMLPIGIKQVYF